MHIPLFRESKFRANSRCALSVVLFMTFFSLFPLEGLSQEPGDANSDLTEKEHIVAPVKLDGVDLFYVRGISSYTAEQRAAAIADRIVKIASDDSISPDSVRTVELKDRIKITVGGELILNIFDEDAELEDIDRVLLASHYEEVIKRAIISYRYERSRPVLFRKLLYAMGAAFALVIILLVLLWGLRKINSYLQKKIRSKIDTLENKSFNLIRSQQLWKAFFLLFRVIRLVFILMILAVFLQYILGLFPWTNNIAALTITWFLQPLNALGRGIVDFLPDLVFLLVIFIVSRYLLKLIKLLFNGLHQGGIIIKNFDPDWALPTFRIMRFFIIVFAIILAYPYIPGSDSLAFKGISVFLGLLVSLGSSSFISNLIAGYTMVYRKPYRKGDRIQINEHTGYVEEQKLFVTRLRSLKNEEIVIPNSVLLNSNIINYSIRARELGLILHTTVGIGYETPWRQVDAMLKEAADRTEGLLREPPPYVLKLSLGDFAINYELNVFCDDPEKINYYYTKLHEHILDVFNENNVQIMTPAYEGDPEIPKVVPKDQWNQPITKLNL